MEREIFSASVLLQHEEASSLLEFWVKRHSEIFRAFKFFLSELMVFQQLE
jgi:hypothetical protein